MIGLDTNILICTAVASHPRHRATRASLASELEAGRSLAVTNAIIGEFLHVITDPRRFDPAWSMAEALDWAESWVASSGVAVLPSNEESLRLSFRWMREYRLGRKRILDTQLAATFHLAGVRRLATSNPDDFRVFGVFELVVPN